MAICWPVCARSGKDYLCMATHQCVQACPYTCTFQALPYVAIYLYVPIYAICHFYHMRCPKRITATFPVSLLQCKLALKPEETSDKPTSWKLKKGRGAAADQRSLKTWQFNAAQVWGKEKSEGHRGKATLGMSYPLPSSYWFEGVTQFVEWFSSVYKVLDLNPVLSISQGSRCTPAVTAQEKTGSELQGHPELQRKFERWGRRLSV